MANELRTRDGLPFNFVDGLRIKGVNVGKWTKISRGTSDTRPALSADEFGVLFMDNSLAAAGKPIWWNGSNWVDSTGTIV